MTSAEQQRLEEVAALAHRNWTCALRTALEAAEPFFRRVARTEARAWVWAQVDRLLLQSVKKWECLREDERQLALAQAKEILDLLRDLGELKE